MNPPHISNPNAFLCVSSVSHVLLHVLNKLYLFLLASNALYGFYLFPGVVRSRYMCLLREENARFSPLELRKTVSSICSRVTQRKLMSLEAQIHKFKKFGHSLSTRLIAERRAVECMYECKSKLSLLYTECTYCLSLPWIKLKSKAPPLAQLWMALCAYFKPNLICSSNDDLLDSADPSSISRPSLT